MYRRATAIFFAKVTSFSFLVGSLIPILLNGGALDPLGLLVAGLSGTMIGLGCLISEFSFLSNRSIRWMRAQPLVSIVAMRAVAYSVIIILGLTVPPLVLQGERLWTDPDLRFNFVISAAIATVISMSIELARLLGREATVAIFTGRYRRPRLEDRIVMFADLIGSTRLAEALGDLRFHELLSDVSYDLSTPIDSARGETHRYVGDAVIITWTMQDSRNFERSLDCALQMGGILAEKSEEYTKRYGQAMQLRIALHCGPVAAGEMGAWKKEIALLGDTMNTAARIEGAARDIGADIVISDAVKTNLPETRQTELIQMPDYQARGKRDGLTLWAVPTAQIAEKLDQSAQGSDVHRGARV